jgi:MoxR-like ATPase
MADGAFSSVDEIRSALGSHAYLADRGLATAIHLALSLDKPLLLEGEAGVGKTEVGKVLAESGHSLESLSELARTLGG